MSPQTRLAHSRRRERGRWRLPQLDRRDGERALLLYRRQRRIAVGALAAMFGLLFLMPLAFALWPGIDEAVLFGIPLPWLLLAVLPYLVMVGLARWALRRAERAESPDAAVSATAPDREG
ncbi:hypothetical protein CFN78_24920 [Amycolatopsis antarctica]|uniref:DUF485 domain-containing protein n=1 Tax=Amycolatopsis antarctica TaxID=1854586 RepID=A0A263CWJ6_9PSEU|nr:hypothetical protein [Amycolatopsis antarctica]OZM70514.1 hypothetical protein CFN78_24920 [Amycolatopsis antarctica]